MNTGTQRVTISSVASSSSQFVVSGPTLPLTLHSGQGASFQVAFDPTSSGNFSGTINIHFNRNTYSVRTISVSGTGLAASQNNSLPPTLTLSASPNALSLGSALAGSSISQSLTLTNTGNASVTISQVAVSGAGFSAGGFSVPLALATGQSASLTVAFSPTAVGSVTGSVSIVSNATNSPTTIALSGTSVQPQISVIPTPVAFGSVTLGARNTQTMTIRNTGTASLNVTQATLSGQGFGLSGIALPLSVAAGGSTGFTLSFTPTSATNFTASLSLISNAPGSPLTVPLSGAGLAQTLQLSVNPSALSFGSATVGTSSTQSVTVSNNGNSTVTVSQIVVTGTAYSITGLSLPVSLSAGQSTSFTVLFTPISAGSLPGSISIVSTATNSPATVTVSGSGVQQVSHSVNLSWSDSSSGLSGFNVYRGTASGGPYVKINSALVPTTVYTDSAVQSATIYYYVTTAVDSTGLESTYSNEASASIP